MKKGTLIAIDGELYEYEKYYNGFHIACEVMIDEDGHLTATYMPHAFSDRALKNNAVNFTKQQWYGIVKHFIRQDFDDLTEEDMNTAVEDIVDRCFALNMPEFEELSGYIACYMNR